MEALLAGLEGWSVARAIRTSRMIYPLVNGAHILAFAMMIGALAVHHITLLRGRMISSLSVAALSVARWGFAAAVLTGGLLFSNRAVHYAGNTAFLTKMGLLCVAGLTAITFHRLAPKMARTLAAVSLLVWVGVLFAGRWIGFA